MKILRSALPMLAAFALLAGCATTKVELNPALQEKVSRDKKFLIMPVPVQVTKSKVAGAERLYELEREFSTIISEAAEQALKELNLEIVPAGLSPKELESNPDLKYEVTDLQDKFDHTLYQEMQGNVSRESLNQVHTLGADGGPFAQAAGGDAIVFIRGYSTIESVPKRLLYAVGGTNIYSGLRINMGLVDGKDGSVFHALTFMILVDQYLKWPLGENDKSPIMVDPKKREQIKNEIYGIIKRNLSDLYAPKTETKPAAPAKTTS